MSRLPAPLPVAPGADPPALGSLDLLMRFGAALAAFAAFASVGTSSLLVVTRIQVEGTRVLSPATVEAAAGVRVGQRLAEVDPVRVTARLRLLPRIARASVEVAPTGRVVLRVVERTPRAAVPYREGYLLVDQEAVVVEHASDPGVLPVVTVDGAPPPWARGGDRIPLPGVAAAVRVVGLLPASETERGVRVRLTASGDVVVITADGLTVLLGPGAAADQRAAILPAALEAARRRGRSGTVVDLRFAGSVYLRAGGVPP
ncbi:MAG: FtsQ-type POTRA domain-containing protein [Armatimonadota bacterium]|nr:FtsQ-type POTRA domain-containing protein [Armatimonadota bacterium]